MAKVKIYRLDGEAGQTGLYYPTLGKAREAFDDMIKDGIEPEGIEGVEIDATRAGLADFLNDLLEGLERK